MSWSDYVTGYLVNNTNSQGKTATNVCEHGAIVGAEDGTVWASTEGFSFSKYSVEVDKEDASGTETVEVDEFANLVDAFANAGVTSKKGGIRINKEKYFTVSNDTEKGVLYLKKNGGGAAVAKSNLGFVIGTFNSKLKTKDFSGNEVPQNPGFLNNAVEDLQAFLLENNL
jgi:hypothetical protein